MTPAALSKKISAHLRRHGLVTEVYSAFFAGYTSINDDSRAIQVYRPGTTKTKRKGSRGIAENLVGVVVIDEDGQVYLTKNSDRSLTSLLE